MMKLWQGPSMVPRSFAWCFLLVLVCSHVIVVSCSSATTTPTPPSFWRPRQEASSSSTLSPSSSSSSWFSFRKTTNDHHSLVKNATTPKSLKQQYIPAWKRSLPEPLCSRSTLERILMPFSTLSGDGHPCFVQVYLLGTAHISTDSCHDVRMLLEHVDPDVLFLELCEQRMGMVLATAPSKDIMSSQEEHHSTNNNLTFWQKVHQLEQDPKQRMSRPAAMATVLLTQVQEEYANSLGVELGGEFRAAYQYYLKRLDQQRQQLQQQQLPPIDGTRRSIHVVLGDRPLFLTLRRGWESLTWWGRTRLLVALAWSSLWPVNPDELKAWMQAILESGDTDILTQSIAELNQTFPSLARTILDERNAYMACKLYQTCRCMMVRANHDAARRPHQRQQQLDTLHDTTNKKNRNITIVAIVGAGHVKGMVEWFTNGNGQTPEQVLRELVQTKSYGGKNKQTWWQRLLFQKGEQLPTTYTSADATSNDEENYLIENVIELQQP